MELQAAAGKIYSMYISFFKVVDIPAHTMDVHSLPPFSGNVHPFKEINICIGIGTKFQGI